MFTLGTCKDHQGYMMVVVAEIHKAVNGLSSEHPLLTFYACFRYFFFTILGDFIRFVCYRTEAKQCVCSNFHAFWMSGWWL